MAGPAGELQTGNRLPSRLVVAAALGASLLLSACGATSQEGNPEASAAASTPAEAPPAPLAPEIDAVLSETALWAARTVTCMAAKPNSGIVGRAEPDGRAWHNFAVAKGVDGKPGTADDGPQDVELSISMQGGPSTLFVTAAHHDGASPGRNLWTSVILDDSDPLLNSSSIDTGLLAEDRIVAARSMTARWTDAQQPDHVAVVDGKTTLMTPTTRLRVPTLADAQHHRRVMFDDLRFFADTSGNPDCMPQGSNDTGAPAQPGQPEQTGAHPAVQAPASRA